MDKKKYPTLYNVDDIQAIFNMNKSTAYKLMQSPNFPRMKIGGRYYITEENLLKFLKQNTGRDIPLQ